MPLSKIIIAIDGYSSCGKSTLAKALAQKLKLNYIDSGAMYRAVTFYFIKNKIPIPLPHQLHTIDYDFEKLMEHIDITFKINQETHFSEIYLNGKNVENEIRAMDVSQNVSHVSAIKAVRKNLVALQQKMQNYGGLVMDGRDIGTTVFPNANLKIFMTAHPDIRAKRRFDELVNKGVKVTFPEVKQNLQSRDYEDSHREESPLMKAEDAIVLDNTFLNHDEQLEFVLKEIGNRVIG
ncbi:MAG: (d)CMP kinase [Bacteroidia bacterium]